MRTRVVFAAVAVLVGSYYSWGVRAAGYDFVWGADLPGYYDHLGRAFAGGHLYLPIEPAKELLALKNPWDPHVDGSSKLFDAVLYNRRYYLYHGAGPAVMLFAPWRMLTHHDLPENFALFLFCFGGFVFSAGALLGLLHIWGVRAGPFTLAAMLIALGFCQGVPFLLNRVWVYEVAIGAGYFCVAAGLFCYVRWPSSRRWEWAAAAGLMFGLAISCRPHLGVFGVFAGAAVAFASPRRAVAFAIPFVLAGLGVAAYNYERFGNPFDFGNQYLLGGENQTMVKLAGTNVAPGMYYMLGAAPSFDPVFPWVRVALPPHDFPRPAIYTVEPTTGALYLAPFLPLALLCLFAPRGRRVFAVVTASAACVLVFITATGWSTQRYEVDFLPWFVLAAMGATALLAERRRWLMPCVAVLVGAGVVVNLGIAIAGPYDEMMRNRPGRFVKIAGWFSPVARFRPVLNPGIDVRFRLGPIAAAGSRRYLLLAGRLPYRYELWVEEVGGSRTLGSSFGGAQVSAEAAGVGEYRAVYSGDSGVVRVSGESGPVMEQKIAFLVAAPSEITCGRGVVGCKGFGE